jgi:sigma-E factor negative regulatory protein RseB
VSVRVLAVTGAAGTTALVLCALAAVGGSQTTATGGGWAGWTGSVDSVSVSDKDAMTPDDAVAVQLLARSARAADTVAYSGRVTAEDGTGQVTTTLVHAPGFGTLTTVMSDTLNKPVFAPDGRSGSFADEGRQLDLLRVNYRVLRQADLDTGVAGRPAEAVVAVAADGTTAARYWIDSDTGLLLRKELVDPSGAVRVRSGFDSLDLSVDSAAVARAAAAQGQDPWGTELDAAGLRAARQAGCDCPDSLPGGLTLVETRRAPAGAVGEVPVVHQLFSDGLVSASLFTLAGSLSDVDGDGLKARGFTFADLGGLGAWVRGGRSPASTATVVWQCDDAVLTLVTDDALAPMDVARSVLSALPPSVAVVDDSFVGRVVRGWHRVVGGGS